MMRLPTLVGVIHLPPLPGSPGEEAGGQAPDDPAIRLQRAGLWAVKEAKLLAQAGFQGIILENFGDSPFFRDQAPPETIASLAIIAAAVREVVPRTALGINVLRNDALGALALASVSGSEFIRVNVLSGVTATDQGLIQGDAARVIRERQRLGSGVAILADVHVKHARSLSSDDPAAAAEDLVTRARADGLIVTGKGTGKPVDWEVLKAVSQAARGLSVPLWVGSGATPQNLAELKQLADGVIVGSALRRGGRAGAPLETARVRAFAREFFRRARKAPARKRRRSGGK